MKKILSLFWAILLAGNLSAQVVTTSPQFPTASDEIVVTFDATQGNQGLMGFTGDVYAHTGLITENSSNNSDWRYVKTDWGENTTATQLTRIDDDLYTLTISPDLITYYGVPDGEQVLKMAFVFRSADNSLTGRDAGGADIFVDIYEGGLSVEITSPMDEMNLLDLNANVQIEASASEEADLTLYIDNSQVATQSAATEISYSHTATEYGKHWIKVVADNGALQEADSAYYFVMQQPTAQNLPAGWRDGINYIDDQTVGLVLYAPWKENVFVIGDFNNWELEENFQMTPTPDGERYWLQIDNLTAGQEYIYQYLVDGEIRVADPYTDKVSDPWNDKYISPEVYPNLIEYPDQKTTGIASVLQPGQTPFQWEVQDFQVPKDEDLVIYELHIRDFTKHDSIGDIKTLKDTLNYLQELGVTAIELMPINEFEGNDSWGYNPSFYFAPDKAYGTKNDYKAFIDECHKRGIAVFIDMVLNHSYSQSPLVQLYFDASAGDYGQPSAQNPWYNQTSPNPDYYWGHDFDHQSPQTQAFVDSVVHYWISEYKVDGFRFDFTKGFTNTPGSGWDYDAQRIGILKRMADHIWSIESDVAVILEHFADNWEEIELSNYGMFIWGNENHQYGEAAMGYASNLSNAFHSQLGWDYPHRVAYMESHDEERLMYKTRMYGNSDGSYDVTELETALERMKLNAAFFLTIPGPKMIWQFGELGYDISIDYNGRTGMKPVKWSYWNDWDRRQLYNFYAALIEMKTTEDVFETTDYTYSLDGFQKRINLNHASKNVTIIGNFDVQQGTIDPQFQHTGRWYNLANGDSIEVSDVNAEIALEPGEYRIYCDAKLGTIDNSVETLTQNEMNLSVFPNPSAGKFNFAVELPSPQAVSLEVYSPIGKKVFTRQYRLSAGSHILPWSGNQSDGTRCAQGIYFYKIKTASASSTGKLMVR